MKTLFKYLLIMCDEALPYLAGAAAISIGWALLGLGLHPILATGASALVLGILVGTSTFKAIRWEKRREFAECPTLPIKVQKDAPVDEIEIPWYEDDDMWVDAVEVHDGETAPISEPELEPASKLPADALVEIKESDETTPSIIPIKVFVNGEYIRTMRFPNGRRILGNSEGMIRHARKYSDVVDALQGLTITSQSYQEGNGVYFTAAAE
jgi:hypothetical protein